MKILCIRTGCYEGSKFLLLSHYNIGKFLINKAVHILYTE